MADLLHRIPIDAPPERVYEAITTPRGLREWWTADSRTDPVVGGEAVFRFNKGKVVFRMHIDELKPNERVAWTCLGDDQEWKGTKITFDIAPSKSGGSDLRFAHREWRSTDAGYPICNSTWGELMYRLKASCEGRSMGPHFTG